MHTLCKVQLGFQWNDEHFPDYKQLCAKIAQEPQILPNVTNPQNVFLGAIMSQTLAHDTPGFSVMKGSYHHSSFDFFLKEIWCISQSHLLAMEILGILRYPQH